VSKLVVTQGVHQVTKVVGAAQHHQGPSHTQVDQTLAALSCSGSI
jgi:hypothetical protein